MSPRVIDDHTRVPEGHIALVCRLCGQPTLFGPDDFPLDVRDGAAWWRRICCTWLTGVPDEMSAPLDAGLRGHLRKIGAI